jgi:hypothetical protein
MACGVSGGIFEEWSPMSDGAREPSMGKGLPGYHDPTAGIGGAAPAISALTLRLCLAVFGLVISTAFAIWLYVIKAPIIS